MRASGGIRTWVAAVLLVAAPGFVHGQPAPSGSATDPVAGGASTPAAQRRQALEEFARVVVGRMREDLQRGVVYPSEALANRWEGTVRIAVLYGRAGDLQDIVVSASSGHRVLDETALELVRKIDLPRAPAALHGSEFDVTFPVAFRLRASANSNDGAGRAPRP
jgi:TonB family protein